MARIYEDMNAFRRQVAAAGGSTTPQEADEMQHDFPVPDYYTANTADRMWVSECIAWGTAHAARARDAAAANTAALSRVEKLLSTIDARLKALEAKQ